MTGQRLYSIVCNVSQRKDPTPPEPPPWSSLGAEEQEVWVDLAREIVMELEETK